MPVRFGTCGFSQGCLGSGAVGRRVLPGVVQPAVPFGRHPARLGLAVVDHPAPAAVGGLVVDVALGVLADAPALAPGVELRAQGVAVPPGEDLGQEAHRSAFRRAPPVMAHPGAGVQRRPPRMSPCKVSYWHETLSGSPGAPPKGGEKQSRGRNGRSGGGRPKGADRHAPAEREASCLPEAGARHAGEASGRRRHGPPGQHAGEMRAVLGRPVQVADHPLGRVAASPSPPRARSCPTAPPRPRSSGTRRSPRRR